MSLPATQAADGSEDVNDFLQRIKELGEKRDSEDEERTRKLEEEILQGRKERQARRAERARSISPTKSSPANTPTNSRISNVQTNSLSQSGSPRIPPQTQSQDEHNQGIEDAMEGLVGGSTSPNKENSSTSHLSRVGSEFNITRNISNNASPSNAMPARTPTLSWQQRRPASQASDRPKSRPLSMVATENAARSPKTTPTPDVLSNSPEPTMSREEIAHSLASKSPDWFKQTADRGINSPAYRKNQVEDGDRLDHGITSTRIHLPGMAQKLPSSGKILDDTVDHSSSPSRSSAVGSGYQPSPKISSSFGSPMPLTPAQILDPPSGMRSEDRSFAMSPSQGRISPERLDRPISPTKGMGGFVQSAMMKRSDSVNKRWSVQSPPGLSRGNSVVSKRASQDLGGSIGSAAGKDMKPSNLSRETSPRPNSRPSSSHSNNTLILDRPGTSNSMKSSLTVSTNNESSVKPFPSTSRSQTPLETRPSANDESTETAPRRDKTPPTSPSKTMDSRRWSPTKSSWLESALNKPESPKPKTAPPPQQPAWMSEINKAKQKASADLGRNPTNGPKHDVNIGGLLRSPPMGGPAKPLSIGGLPAGFSSGPTPKGRSDSIASLERKASIDSSTSLFAAKASPVVTKVKPETPPKKDFRAVLKPRQTPLDTDPSTEPEFKNVFGQLRRTKTQNYVAPDELKDNITRGKSALNVTGGPKKTERKDEFKEAILKKKEDFKQAQLEGKGVTRASSSIQDVPLAEALAKRRTLGRSGSVTTDSEASSYDSQPKRGFQESPKPNLVKETSSPARLEGKEPAAGKLAGRLNPNLASLLARGPPSVASDASRSSSPSFSQRTVSKSESAPGSVESGPQLTHMTKSRARGPRRKAPSSTPQPVVSDVTLGENQPATVVESLSRPNLSTDPKYDASSSSLTRPDSENLQSQPPSPRKLDLKRRSQFLQEVPDKNNKSEPQLDPPKPLSPTKQANTPEISLNPQMQKPEVQSTQMSKPKPSTPAKSPSLASGIFGASPSLSRTEPPVTTALRPLPQSPIKPKATENLSKEPINTTISKSTTVPWEDRTVMPLQVKQPIRLPTHLDEKAAMIQAGLRPASPTKDDSSIGLDIQTTKSAARPLPTPPNKAPLSPPLSAGLRSPASTVVTSNPGDQASEASKILDDFFGKYKSATQFKFDTATLLSARPNQDTNIKTLRSSLYQIFSDGKKQPVPSHQERILFEENLYLCTHIFGDSSGMKKTEVYLWHGDQVTGSVVDETTLFANREAKSSGCKLIVIRQGKETPEFFNALGGIVIIRRGSSNKYDSLAPHILCGRKHFGQIAFDEVEFSLKSLCSGFPYLISTSTGKCYLWKGKGSGIEELSCARLIGMDFGLTGEIEEIDDGKEPPSFLEIFGKSSQVPKSADHWRMKPNYNKYCIRLFIADADAKEQIQELSPFCQFDFDVGKIYVLDAFFEIYIIVGSAAKSQYSAFHNALMFAQEYGILAAGMEDRPFVPVTTVVLEGVPKDMKAVFRKWVESMSPTYHKPPENMSGLRRWKSLRVLPLTTALEATRK